MGTAYRRLAVEVTGSVGGFMTAMNKATQGISRVSSGFRSGNHEAGLFTNQMKAIGTTARYWLAGQMVFGVMAAVQSLAQFKTQLGEIDALASAAGDPTGGLHGLGSQLDDIGSQAILMSNKFGISVTEVETYMQRFYTSFRPTGTAKQNQKQMQDFVDAHLELVTMLGSRAGDPNALAGGLAALVKSMPGGEKQSGRNAKILSNYFARIITQSPSLSGQDIANAAGRLAQVKTLSGMNMPQLLAAFGLAAKTGGSPSVMIRGMTQLLGTSLMHPTRPQSLQTYRAAGLPTDPNMLAKMGGQKVLEHLITYVQAGRRGPGQRNLNLDAVYNAFSRQESVRQFISLISNGGIPALKNYNKELRQAAKENLAARAAKRRLDQSVLVRMGVARQNLGISLMSGADWPLEHLIADPIIGASNLAARHRTATGAVVGGALSLGAANALRRFGAFNRLGKFGGKFGRIISGASAIEKQALTGAISKEELPAAIAGGHTDGSRANPYWVTIDPLSWMMAPTDLFGGGGTAKKEDATRKAVKDILTKSAGPLSGAGGAAAGGGFLAGDIALGATGIGLPLAILLASAYFGTGKGPKSSALEQAMATNAQKPMPGSMLPGLGKQTLYATFDINVKHPDGSTSKKHMRGVPVQIQGARQFPSAQGKPGSRGGGR